MKIYDTAGNLLPVITDKDSSYTYDKSTDSLEAIRDRIDVLNTADQTDLDQLLVYCDILDHATNGLANIYANIASILVDYLNHGTWGLSAIRTGVADVKTDTYNIHNNVLSALSDYLGHGTWGLAQIRAALQLVQTDADQIDANVLSIINDHLSQMKTNLVRWGQVSAVGSSTEFTATQLAGLGVDAMPAGWYVYVMQADDGAPEGEYRLITDYTNAGVVSHEAFSTGLAIGDRVLLLHPSIGMLGQVDTTAATGAVTNTDFMMAYVKQLVTQLLATEASQATHRTALTNHESSQSTHRGNWTPTRAGYIDNLSAGAAALASVLGALNTAAATGGVDTVTTAMGYIKQLVTAMILVLADTAELQGNQAAWATATGFATETKQNIIDGFHDVPGEDAAADAQMRDVVGKKTDTTSGTSIVSIAKQVKAKTDNIPASPAPAQEYDTEMARITAAVATATALTTAKGVIDAIKTIVDTPANFMADLSTLETRLSATKSGYLDEAISAAKKLLSSDWKGNFNWDTSAYTDVEQDISALFSTNLALTTRRKYSVKLDLTAVEADGSFDELYLAVKEKIDGTNYRAIDRKTILKADIAAAAEPGIIIDIPATSENIQITIQMKIALAGDATIYYAVVKEHLE